MDFVKDTMVFAADAVKQITTAYEAVVTEKHIRKKVKTLSARGALLETNKMFDFDPPKENRPFENYYPGLDTHDCMEPVPVLTDINLVKHSPYKKDSN